VAFLLIAALGQTILKLLLGGVAVFLILLVLVQRGRGGGLAGALGGMGGSSAFGAKAGDVFTRITIISAAVWIVLCIAAAKFVPSGESRLGDDDAAPASATASLSGVEADEQGEEAVEDAVASEPAADSQPSQNEDDQPQP